jgi:L-asparagine transporter-like permease
VGFAIISIVILVIIEFATILIFKYGYFKSVVKDEEKILLCQYIKNAMICFILIYLICINFLGDIQQIEIYVFSYLPVLLLTFGFIYLKIKKKE